jgi:energy-coupling factor transport system permease protein
MAISLALRFIPTLAEETDKIMKAQASRGVDFKQGKFKDKIKAIVSLIIPLFMSAFMTSGELADAMEARGYDPNAKRTRYRAYRWSLKDTCGVILSALFLAGMIVLAVKQYDLFALLNVSLPILS